MIEPTDEMVTVFMAEGTDGWGGVLDARVGLTAVLTIVERDYRVLYRRLPIACFNCGGAVEDPRLALCCEFDRIQPAGIRSWATGRGGSHPHYCASCSEDGRASGPGCINCRQTGFDQSPWPDCEQCRFARRVAAS